MVDLLTEQYEAALSRLSQRGIISLTISPLIGFLAVVKLVTDQQIGQGQDRLNDYEPVHDGTTWRPGPLRVFVFVLALPFGTAGRRSCFGCWPS